MVVKPDNFWRQARKAPAKVVQFDGVRLPIYGLHGIKIRYSLREKSFQVWDHLHTVWINLQTGDWISEGPKKEHYPIRKEIFDATYTLDDR